MRIRIPPLGLAVEVLPIPIAVEEFVASNHGTTLNQIICQLHQGGGDLQTYGADSFVGRLACLFQGATDTTFYILAVYFGSVGIRKTRHAVTCGLLADLAGILAAIGIAYIFF